MMQHSIYFVSFLIMVTANSSAALAKCDDMSSQIVQPLEFGLMRYDNSFMRGTASVWPTGFVQMPRGLSLSSSSNAHPAIIRLASVRAREIAFRVENDVVEGREIGSLLNIKISVIGASYEYDGAILRILANDSRESLINDITIIFGGDLDISLPDKKYDGFRAIMKLRCLYQV